MTERHLDWCSLLPVCQPPCVGLVPSFSLCTPPRCIPGLLPGLTFSSVCHFSFSARLITPLRIKLSRPCFPSWNSFLASSPLWATSVSPVASLLFPSHLSRLELPHTLNSPTPWSPNLYSLGPQAAARYILRSAGERRSSPPPCHWQALMSILYMFPPLLLPQYIS